MNFINNGRQMAKSFEFQPIGFFKSNSINNYDLPRQPLDQNVEMEATNEIDKTTSFIELIKNHQFEQALENLHGFSRIWVLFHFHKNQTWLPKTLPPRGSDTKLGVFSTRSPYRPNPIGLSCLKLIKIENLKLYVTSSDILDETPILDIKPYIPEHDSFPSSRVGWLEKIEDSKFTLQYSDLALKQLEYLTSQHQLNLIPFIQRSLEYDPLNSDKKRLLKINHLTRNEASSVLCYRTWRIQFQINLSSQRVTIQSIFSGYRENELLLGHKDFQDIYKDKSIHIEFNQTVFENF
jgi:tRNA-Thr(GGU) m(6)t(6)A37 methyltransferase TsaA